MLFVFLLRHCHSECFVMHMLTELCFLCFSADEDIDSKFPVNVIVNSDGTLSWVPLGLYISSCAIDIRWFPFDDQV